MKNSKKKKKRTILKGHGEFMKQNKIRHDFRQLKKYIKSTFVWDLSSILLKRSWACDIGHEEIKMVS